jgi:hypothetical protein
MKMNKRNINLLLFSLFLALLISVPILHLDKGVSIRAGWSQGPWHLIPFGADSLSQHYKDRYQVLDEKPLASLLQDSAKPLVMILVDGWGVPYDESLLEADFQMLGGKNVSYAVHKRLFQTTSFAESIEYGSSFKDGVVIDGDDSAGCAKIDSLISDGSWSRVAWTARSTREGDRNKLHNLLKGISAVATKHPDVQFVVQGTHRPILGTPETRRKYLAPWVPAVFINCNLEQSIVR